jgi:hypothetical protein
MLVGLARLIRLSRFDAVRHLAFDPFANRRSGRQAPDLGGLMMVFFNTSKTDAVS